MAPGREGGRDRKADEIARHIVKFIKRAGPPDDAYDERSLVWNVYDEPGLRWIESVVLAADRGTRQLLFC